MGICIEIEMSDEGTFSVRECAPKEESMEAQGQQFASAEEAMQAAMQMLTAGQGQGAAMSGAGAEQDMMAGFETVRGKGLNG